jgi:hypothetical protein
VKERVFQGLQHTQQAGFLGSLRRSCGVQDPELMDLMVQFYSGLHPSDMFHPDTEPLPGSYLC